MVFRVLVFALLIVGLTAGTALAAEQAGGGSPWLSPFYVLTAGFAMAFASGLCALGQGRAISAAVEAISRQPGAAARIQTAMIIGLALIESLALYVFVIAAILLFVQPVK